MKLILRFDKVGIYLNPIRLIYYSLFIFIRIALNIMIIKIQFILKTLIKLSEDF